MPVKSADEAIRQAIEAGKFDNLPGKGKPIQWERINTIRENPLADPEWQLAYTMLRSSGYTLPWIEVRQEIETDLGAARAALGRSWAWRQDALAAGQALAAIEPEWQRAVALYRQRAEALNRRIQAYNIQAPLAQFQKTLINIEQDIEAVQQA